MKKSTTSTAKKTEYYDDGKLYATTPYQNGKRNGEAKIYSKAVKIKSIVPYVNNMEHGIIKDYYDDGQIAAEISVENGKRNGMDRRYYPNGQLQSEHNYENDEIQGTIREYDEEGHLTRKAIGLHGYAAEHIENPQQQLEHRRWILLGITLGGLLMGILCGFIVAKIWRRK